MKVTLLGSGTSHGVPSIDCIIGNFASCPKGVCGKAVHGGVHNRTRCSIVVEYNGKSVLVDVSMDFREQIIRERIGAIDAVLITHAHADHIGGIPDIRSFTRNSALPMYGSAESLGRIRGSFDYIFNPPEMRGGGIPDLVLHEITQPFDLFGFKVIPVPVEHGSLSGVYGYRIGNLAYVPDIKRLKNGTEELLSGLDCLIIDALRDERSHSTHLILPESIALARELKPAKTYFTHLTHNIDCELDAALLDKNQFFAFDGLQVEIV